MFCNVSNMKCKISLLFSLMLLSTACVSTSINTETRSPRNDDSLKSNIQPPVLASTKPVNLQLGLMVQLLGDWEVQDWQLQSNGEWQVQAGAKWSFVAIQGGTAIRDEWQSNVIENEQSPSYTTHIRVYEPFSSSWQAARLSSRSREIEYLSGQENKNFIEFVSQHSQAKRITKSTFKNISQDSFESEIAWSKDSGRSWLVVYKLKAKRL